MQQRMRQGSSGVPVEMLHLYLPHLCGTLLPGLWAKAAGEGAWILSQQKAAKCRKLLCLADFRGHNKMLFCSRWGTIVML